MAMQTGSFNPEIWDQAKRIGHLAFEKGYPRKYLSDMSGLSNWDVATRARYYLESLKPRPREREIELALQRIGGGRKKRYLRPYEQRNTWLHRPPPDLPEEEYEG